MLRLQKISHLARLLDLDASSVRTLAESADSHCEELILIDPSRPEKSREVVDVTGALREAQDKILQRILYPSLRPSNYSFGCIRGRHIKMNVEHHMRSKFAFSCDISDFYHTIKFPRVYRFFSNTCECHPDVARILTQLCTYQYHLALGLITSPILADQILIPIDHRIASMAHRSRLVYSRFVDDITISGDFDLRKSGFPSTIKDVLNSHGFSTKSNKDNWGRIGDSQMLITKIRVNRGHLDVSKKYIDDLVDLMHNLRALGEGKAFGRSYYTRSQVWGRIQFVAWINPRRLPTLKRLFHSIRWDLVQSAARNRGLVITQRRLVSKAC